MLNSSKPKMNFYSFNLNHKKGKIMDAAKNKRSQGWGRNPLRNPCLIQSYLERKLS